MGESLRAGVAQNLYGARAANRWRLGIDGIYVDIPYWMTHFEGWEDTWASFDDYTVEAFRKESGLERKEGYKAGRLFAISIFESGLDFRIQTFTDFMQEIDRNAKSVNPADQSDS